VSTLQHCVTGSLERILAQNIHRSGFTAISDISAYPMDIIEINRLLPLRRASSFVSLSTSYAMETNMSAASIQSVRPTRRIGAWTLQGIIAAAFLAAGFAKLAGVPFMVDLFAQIGLGQWFRVVTGVVEVTGAVALLVPGLASIGALWLGGTMVGAVATHVFVLHTSPVPAIVLGVLNAVVVYLRRDELVALLHRVKG
jgi:putative oxidoreductase